MRRFLGELLKTIKYYCSHRSLREIAHTLNHFNIIEIYIVIWASYEVSRMLSFYMSIMTVDKFNGVAFWGAIGGIIVGMIGAVKYISDTLKYKRDLND